MGTVADRHAVAGAHTAETPALHRTGKTLALRDALDVDDLAGDEMVGPQLGADVDRRVVGDPEFDELRLEFDLRLRKGAALPLGAILRLRPSGPHPAGHIAAALLLATRNARA